MKKAASPQLGYNTNARHRGKVYHIQTEDSGVQRPHVITHVFADGGRIVATRKTSYADVVGSDGYKEVVKKLMQEQHKAMFLELRSGTYDADLEHGEGDGFKSRSNPPAAPASVPKTQANAPATRPALTPKARVPAGKTVAFAAVKIPSAASSDEPPTTQFQPTRSVQPASNQARRARTVSALFDRERLSEKTLDEVILGYLAEELEEAEL